MSGNSKRRRHEYGGEDVHNRQQKRKVVSILKKLSLKDEVFDERVYDSRDNINGAHESSNIVSVDEGAVNNDYSGINGLISIESKKRFNYAVDRLVDNLLRKSHRKSLHNNSRADSFTSSSSELDFYLPSNIGPQPCCDHALSLYLNESQTKSHLKLNKTQIINRNNDIDNTKNEMFYSSFNQPQFSKQTHSGHVSHMDWGIEERKISSNDLMSCDDMSSDYNNDENNNNENDENNENDDAIDIFY